MCYNEAMKTKKQKYQLLKVGRFYKKYVPLLILTCILSISYAGFSVWSTVLSGNLLDSFTNFNLNNSIKIALILCSVYLFTEIVIHFWSMTVLKLNSNVDFDIKHKLLISLTKLKVKNFDNLNSGVFVARINKDVYNLSELFDAVTDDLSTILLNISFILYSLFINIYLGLFLIAYIVFMFIWDTFKNKHFMKKHLAYKKLDEQVVGSYGEIIRGIRDIKNLNLKEPIISKVDVEQSNAIIANKERIHVRRSWNRGREAFKHIFDLLFVILSCYMIANSTISIGNFLILFLYKSKIQSFINSISNIKDCIAESEISAKRVFEIIEDDGFEKESFGAKSIESINGKIEFKNVTFSYNNEKLFENLSLQIPPNKIISFVGKSGEGKSTIINLINKNYLISGGQILIDGIDLNELSEESIRKNISVVPQIPYIFNMSIADNLRLVKPEASKEQIEKVCKSVGIDEFIQNLPDKYDSFVGENGITLSGGQRQRLAIARCLLKESKIILFDEATSALDNETQDKIKNVIFDVSKDHTIIVIAHRLSTIIGSDKIFVLNGHEIEAEGTHEELLKTSKTYKKLYKDFKE